MNRSLQFITLLLIIVFSESAACSANAASLTIDVNLPSGKLFTNREVGIDLTGSLADTPQVTGTRTTWQWVIRSEYSVSGPKGPWRRTPILSCAGEGFGAAKHCKQYLTFPKSGFWRIHTLAVVRYRPQADKPTIGLHSAHDTIVTVLQDSYNLEEVTFRGAGYHAVSYDGANPYGTPQWCDHSQPRNGTADDTVDFNFPLCYTRGSNLLIEHAKIVTNNIKLSSPIKLRAVCNTVVFNETTATTQNGTIIVHNYRSQTPLPSTVAILDPLTITWQIKPEHGDWQTVAISEHRLYLTLADPLPDCPLYESVLDMSCRNHATNAKMLRDAVWTRFKTLSLSTVNRDGYNYDSCRRLKYFAPGNDNPPDLKWMLRSQIGSGNSRAWSDLFIVCLQTHGLMGYHRYRIEANTPGEDLMVKNWRFGTPDRINAIYPYLIHTSRWGSFADHLFGVDNGDTFEAGSIPAQGNNRAPSIFNMHYVVGFASSASSRLTEIYDPSHGISSNSLRAYANKLLAGFCWNMERARKKNPDADEVNCVAD